MEKTEIIDVNKTKVFEKAGIFSILIAAAIVLPAVIHNQLLTGPIINSLLFLGSALLAPELAILVGILPSLVALSSGLLPAPLAPMIPFIMVSNVILIVIFYHLRKKNYWLGVGAASVLKFLFLLGSSSIVINLLLKKELAKQVSMMMSLPQLLTALAGGFIAFIVLKLFKSKTT
jgi:hypothetical protein